jgi:pSer/pThr/pTyr-binding forkhead associated (FHA) protein
MTANIGQNLPPASAIVLNLVNSIPAQSWNFDCHQTIRIGRATDNNVILFSAVVSRHHAELRWLESEGWQIRNLSSNGTYINGKPVQCQRLENDIVFRLATSGPKIQVKLVGRSGINERHVQQMDVTNPTVATGEIAEITINLDREISVNKTTDLLY